MFVTGWGETHVERFGELEGIWGAWGKVGGPRVGFEGSRVSTEVGGTLGQLWYHRDTLWGTVGVPVDTEGALGKVWGVRGKLEASGGRI